MILRPSLLCLALLSAVPAGAIPAVDRSTPALRALAEQREPAAMARLGWHYYYGEGVPEDKPEAARWFRAAAAQGNPSGLFGLSRILRWGHGVPQDIAEGDRMMMEAAEKGDAAAQVAAGNQQERAQAWLQARQWYEKADAQGHPGVQRYLGYLLLRGLGGPRDAARGLSLLRQSADRGDGGAIYFLAEAYELADGVEEDPALARELYRRAAALGNGDAPLGLASLLLDGKGGARDIDAALQLYRASADKGHARAALMLAMIYSEGREGVPAHPPEMLRWLARAVDLGNPYALVWQGRLYLEGTQLPADSARAVTLFTRAAQSGYYYAKYWLGMCLEEGRGVAKDEARAVELYREISGTEPMALYRYASMLLDGRGTARDPAAVQALVDAGLARREVAAMLQLVALLLSDHRIADVEPLLQRVMQHPASASARSELAFIDAVGRVGKAYRDANKLVAAQSWLQERLALLEKLPAQDNAVMAEALEKLGIVHALRRQRALADEAFVRSVVLLRERGGKQDGALAEHYASIADAYMQGDFFLQAVHYRELAMKLHQEADRGNSQAGIENVGSLGLALHALGRYGDAAAVLSQAAERAQAVYGKSGPWYWYYLLYFGNNQLALGQLDDARASFRRVLALSNNSLARPNLIRASALKSLGALETQAQRYDEAEGWLRKSLAILEPLAGNDSHPAAVSMMELGKLLAETGRYQQAEVQLARALEIMLQMPSSAGWDAAKVLHEMGRNQAKQGKHASAAEYFERALAMRSDVQPAHHKTRETAAALAAVYRSLGRDDAARELEERMDKAGQARTPLADGARQDPSG